MKIKMDLLENAQDYVINALELYRVADEFGMYREDVAIKENKAKWKLAFVSLVQGLEILMKFGLEKINPALIYENIDATTLSVERTVKFVAALNRLSNLNNNPFSDDEIEFIKKCIKYRNNFTHYKVDMYAEEIKSKFAELYMLYCKGFEFYSGEKIYFNSDRLANLHLELCTFVEDYTFYRGVEVKKSELEEIKEEVKKWGGHSYFTTTTGKRVTRIAYGDEYKHCQDESGELYELYRGKYCDDCGARLGEYHLPDCDLEVCPICKRQKISCNCDLFLEGLQQWDEEELINQ